MYLGHTKVPCWGMSQSGRRAKISQKSRHPSLLEDFSPSVLRDCNEDTMNRQKTNTKPMQMQIMNKDCHILNHFSKHLYFVFVVVFVYMHNAYLFCHPYHQHKQTINIDLVDIILVYITAYSIIDQ